MRQDVFLIQFIPERWSNLEKLLRHLNASAGKNGNVRKGLHDCSSHLAKIPVFWRIAEKLRPGLQNDENELETYGGTSGLSGAEMAAIFESIICELYSALDGLRLFFYGEYRNVKGVQNSSNGKLFGNAENQKYGPEFPEEIRCLLSKASAEWFLELRGFRTELTHGSAGFCSWNKEKDTITYMNQGIKDAPNRLQFIDDMESKIRFYEASVMTLVEAISEYYLDRVDNIPVFQVCGMFKARVYTRAVVINRNTVFSDGHCLAHEWFDRDPELRCPIAERCAAYGRKFPGGLSAFQRMMNEGRAIDTEAGSGGSGNSESSA